MPDFNPQLRTPATTVAGSRGPENENQVRVVLDVNDKLYLYQPSASPLSTFTGRIIGQREVHNYDFKFLEQDEYPRDVQLAAASLIADTTLDLVAGQGVRVPRFGLYLNLRTEERVWVSGTIVTDQVTVTRGVGSAQADMNAGDTLILLGQVFADGAGKGDFKTVQVANEYNYTQILKTGVGWTGRALFTKMFGGSDQETTRHWLGIEHAKSIEYMMLFGVRDINSSQTHLTTFSGGADYFIKSNRWNVAGSDPTEDAFLEVLEEVMRWGKGGNQNGRGIKYAFASSRWITKLNRWAKDAVRITQDETTLGIKIMSYDSPHGEVKFVHTPILDYNHKDKLFLVDLNHARQVVHEGRGTKLIKGIEDNDFDGKEEQYMSDIGAEWSLEQSHAVFSGLGL